MRDASVEWPVADAREVKRTWLIAITAATALTSMMLTAFPARADSDMKAAKGTKLTTPNIRHQRIPSRTSVTGEIPARNLRPHFRNSRSFL